MSLLDDPISPTETNRASQEPRESPQDSSFLRAKETEKKGQTSMIQETQNTFDSSINTYEEVLNRYESYRDNPTYYDSDNILMYTTSMLSPSGCMFEGSFDSAGNIGSQKDPDPTQMMPTSGGFSDAPEMPKLLRNSGSQVGVVLRPDMEQVMSNISTDSIDLASLFADSTEDSQLPYEDLQDLGMQVSGEGYGTNTSGPLKDESNTSFGSFGSFESMMNAQREREKIVMIPTPRTVNAPQWTIKKKLTSYDVNAGTLVLPHGSFDEHIRRHFSEEDYRMVVFRTAITVDVYDYDLGTMHKMRLTIKNRNGLTDGWLEDFVRRRGLRERDEIGLVWDSSASMLLFGVISRYKRLARQKNS